MVTEPQVEPQSSLPPDPAPGTFHERPDGVDRSGIESRTADTHIAKLRAKLDRGERSRIVTVRKKGYRLR